MSGNASSPLLRAEEPAESTEQPSNPVDVEQEGAAEEREEAPLLGDESQERDSDGSSPPSRFSLKSFKKWTSRKRGPLRWPSIVAILLLLVIIIIILGFAFAAPSVAEEYAKEATVFEPTGLSIEGFTTTGVKARVQGDFTLDGSRVRRKPVRDIGRAAAWIVKAVETKESVVEVYLPEYDDTLVGTAVVPGIVVNLREGVITHIDFITDLEAGDLDGLKSVARAWIEGKISRLNVRGEAIVPLKSGIFNIGTKALTQDLIFDQNDVPAVPQYDISKINFHETDLPKVGKIVQADVSAVVANKYPVQFTVPPLGFKIMVSGCNPDQPEINVADAQIQTIHVEPKQDVPVHVVGLVHKLPKDLTSVCPKLLKSPLDILLSDYLKGDDLTLYVSGSNDQSPQTPPWIADFLKDIVVPVDLHGKTFDKLIRNFSMEDVHFGLPDPFSGPDSPDSKPRVSATIQSIINLPDEMNFNIEVSRVKANAEIFSQGKKLGNLDLNEWQKAKSKRIEEKGQKPGLQVSSIVKDAPIDITDNQVFADLVRKVVFGGKEIVLTVKAAVDVETSTVLGELVVRDIPAEGEVFVNPFSGGNSTGDFSNFLPKISGLRILDTGRSWIKLAANVNFTNPTNYSASVPYFDLKLLNNGTELGHAFVRNATIVPGNNTNIPIIAFWQPQSEVALLQGREVLSQYVSGYNVTLTLQTHEGTVPTQPALGNALAQFPVDIPAPALHTPRDPSKPGKDHDPGAPTFIDDTTFHLLTSTATFTILSPLHDNSIWVQHLNATAFYNLTHPVGVIQYDEEWEIPPGISESPLFSVDWSLGGVGYSAIKDALGGHLKLAAKANATIRVDKWIQSVWIEGRGIGAHIRI